MNEERKLKSNKSERAKQWGTQQEDRLNASQKKTKKRSEASE